MLHICTNRIVVFRVHLITVSRGLLDIHIIIRDVPKQFRLLGGGGRSEISDPFYFLTNYFHITN